MGKGRVWHGLLSFLSKCGRGSRVVGPGSRSARGILSPCREASSLQGIPSPGFGVRPGFPFLFRHVACHVTAVSIGGVRVNAPIHRWGLLCARQCPGHLVMDSLNPLPAGAFPLCSLIVKRRN